MQLNTLIKRLRNEMRNDAGVSGDAQRLEQMTWLVDFCDATLAGTDPLGWALRDLPEIGFPESTKLLLRMQQRTNDASTRAR